LFSQGAIPGPSPKAIKRQFACRGLGFVSLLLFTVSMISTNILIQGIVAIQERLALYVNHARDFYFELLLTTYPCPVCGEKMRAVAPGRWECPCSATVDPTIAFQTSPCCGDVLVLRRTHYACRSCGTTVPSRFLFDESVFDADYFRSAMAESRERKRCAREELRLLLASSHSKELQLTDVPDMMVVPGLLDALADFLRSGEVRTDDHPPVRSDFRMEQYRAIVLRIVHEALVHFDAIPFVNEDSRLDRARRFTTLVFMEQAREIRLEQTQTGILVVPCV